MQQLRDQATAYFMANDYQSMHETLRTLENENDPWGIHYLAGAFSYGFGVPVDLEKAHQLYCKSAVLGFADSQAIIGNNFCAGIGCTKNITLGHSWLMKASMQGHTYADFLLSKVFINGLGTPENKELGIKHLEQAAFNGYAEAQRVLGGMKIVGNLTEVNVNEGVALLILASDQSNSEASYDLGKIYESGEYLEKNYTLAAKYLLAAAENEHVRAMHDVGVLYFNGTGVSKDISIAKKWYLKAANHGSHLSSFCLGLIEETGESNQGSASIPLAIVWYLISNAQSDGSDQSALNRIANLKPNLTVSDIETAIRFITAFADERQFPWAQLALGNMYLKGEFVRKDMQTGNKYVSLAAAGGVETARLRLNSRDHEDADLVHQAIELNQMGKHHEAFLLLDAEAERRNPKAQYLTAVMLDSGTGTIQNEQRAREMYFSAAELGSPDAQAHVGGLYALGNGVDVDYEKAAFWFEKAANQGNAIALNDLGNMHSMGLFFEKNEDKAIALYEIAADLGNSAGQYNFGLHLLKSDNTKMISQGVLLMSQAAESGFVNAQTTLGFHYIEGDAVEKDFDKFE